MSQQQVPAFEQRHLPLGNCVLAANDSLDIWLVDIDSASLTRGINTGQLARQKKINQRRFSQKFYTRLILSAYLNKPAAEIKLSYSKQGKPFLDFNTGPEHLHFNLSHSRGWLLLALSRGQEVGVDIECQRQNNHPLKLAERYFSAAEINYLKQFSEWELQQQFIRLWVRKEAALKCIGTGLAGNLANTMCTLINDDKKVRQHPDQVFLTRSDDPDSRTQLEIISFEQAAQEIFAAIAISSLPRTINRYLLNCQRPDAN